MRVVHATTAFQRSVERSVYPTTGWLAVRVPCRSSAEPPRVPRGFREPCLRRFRLRILDFQVAWKPAKANGVRVPRAIAGMVHN